MDRQQMPQQMPSMPTGLGSLAMSDNEPRMQDRSPEEQIFSIESEIKNMMKEYEMAVRNGENQRAQMIADQVGKLDEMKIEIQRKFISEEGNPMGMNLSMPSIYNYRLRKSLESGNIDDIKSEQKGIRNSAIRDMDMIENSGMMQDDPNYAEKMMQMLKGVRGNYAEGDEAKKGGPLGLGIIDAIRGGVGSAFTDPMSAQNYAMNAMKGRMKQDEPTIREMFEKEFKQARMEGKEIFEFMGKMYNTKTAEEVQGMFDGGPLNSMVQQTQQIMNNLGMDVAQDTKIIKNAFGLSDPMMAANILQKTFKNKYPNLKEDDINNLINYGHEAYAREASKNFSNGGEASFPDLNNDGETTYADVLVGRGVKFAEGGEAIDSELAGMQMSEEDAMSEVASLDNPEMKMIEQLIAVVQQLMAQGVGEQEIKMFLKEQGLDDEDINTLFEMLSESDMQQQGAGQIDQQLQGMM